MTDFPRQPRRWRPGRWLAVVGIFALVPLAGPLRTVVLDLLVDAASAGDTWLQSTAAAAPATTTPPVPQADAQADLHVGDEYRLWPLVGTAVGLSYADRREDVSAHMEAASRDRPGDFTHVYLEPSAYRAFRDTGAFPEGTTFVLEIRRPESGVSIARGGHFAGGLLGVHASIKDSARFADGWQYFDVQSDGRALPVRGPGCASCHRQHGAVDSVFTQFYPLLTEARR